MPADRRQRLDEIGVVVVESLLDRTWCDRLTTAIERCRARPGEHYAVLSDPGLPTVDSDLFRWFDDEDIAALTHDSPVTRLAGELLGADEVVLIEDQWFMSDPGARTPSPWHQDHPYYNVDRPFLTIWVTLDDVPEDLGLKVVPGSHVDDQLYAPVEFSTTRATIGEGISMEPVPDIDADPDGFRVSSWRLRAGGAVAIDSRLLHATGAATVVGGPFRRVSLRYATTDTRYVEKGPHVARFWEMVPHGLETGDRLACDHFPVVAAAGAG